MAGSKGGLDEPPQSTTSRPPKAAGRRRRSARLRAQARRRPKRPLRTTIICQAGHPMWTRIGVKTTLQAAPMAQFVTRVMNNDVSAYLFGWGVATFDALYSPKPRWPPRTARPRRRQTNGGCFQRRHPGRHDRPDQGRDGRRQRDALLARRRCSGSATGTTTSRCTTKSAPWAMQNAWKPSAPRTTAPCPPTINTIA